MFLALRPPTHPDLLLAVAALGAYALFTVIAAMFATAIPEMALYMGVTFFLVLVGVLVCCLVATWPQATHAVLGGYCLSSVISTALSLAVVAGLLPLDMVMYDASRVQAFFKDPNVYGPSLVLSILYLLTLLEQAPRRLAWSAAFIVALLMLVLGVLFSASRAAWIDLRAFPFVYIVLRGWMAPGAQAVRFWGLIIAACGVIAAAVVAVTGYEAFMDERQGCGEDYDADRFGAQEEGLEMAFAAPLGGGPGQFESHVGVLGISAHSLYIRTMMENGLPGFFALMLFFALTLLVVLRSVLAGGRFGGVSAAVAASLLGALANGLFVDTLHWRSLWIIQAGPGLGPLCDRSPAREPAGVAQRHNSPAQAQRLDRQRSSIAFATSGTWTKGRTEMTRKTIAIIGDRDTDKFRGWLIRDMIAAGHRVLVCGPGDDVLAAAISRRGAEYRTISIDGTSLNPLAAVSSVLRLVALLRAERVDLVLSHSTKQNVVGPLAAQLAGVAHTFAMIEGFGYAFGEGNEPKRRVLRTLITLLLKISLRRCAAVFVLNEADLAFVRSKRLVRPEQRVVKINGTGIDLTQ